MEDLLSLLIERCRAARRFPVTFTCNDEEMAVAFPDLLLLSRTSAPACSVLDLLEMDGAEAAAATASSIC